MLRQAYKKYPHLNFVQADALDIILKKKFDIIILSDLVNDLWDVQSVFQRLRDFSNSRTRLVLNFYNNYWRLPLYIIKKMGLGAELMEQNWLSPHDITNLLEISGFEIINFYPRILFPLPVKFLTNLANKYLVNFVPFSWFALTNFVIARLEPTQKENKESPLPSVSVIVPTRNEEGNIEDIVKRVPCIGSGTELIFVEGHSTDNTYEKIKREIEKFPERPYYLFRQPGKGKGDAVRMGFEKADGDVLVILDADMTVAPEDLMRFFKTLVSGKGEFINGVRLVYPMAEQAMRLFNMVGNKFFSIAFSWLLGQPIKDTLCGTKVLWRHDYIAIAKNREYFGNFDPFGDFDLLFGAAKLNLKIVDMPIRYRSRTYGKTNIDRWRHGWILLKMVIFAAKRLKFI
jgi:hypothetical protein